MFPRRRLIRAERAMNRGNTGRAARKFHQAADQFEGNGNFVRSAAVRIEAAYAEAMGDEVGLAVQSVGYAMTTLAKLGSTENVRAILGQFTPAIERVAAVLRQNGHIAEAAEIERMLGQANQAAAASGAHPAAASIPAPVPAHGDIPASCASCGAPLLPDAVEWRDPYTAICPFCGSVIKAR